MKRIMVAVPSREQIDVNAVKCLMKLEQDSRLNPELDVTLEIAIGTIIHDLRYAMAQKAIDEKFDYVLWIDADMVFESDVLIDLLADDVDIVTAVCFMRRSPYEPCIYKSLRLGMSLYEDQIEKYLDYPEDDVFEVEACGMAMCLMKVEALKHILTVTGQPFFPVRSNHRTLGEDLSFCYKARSMGYKIYADPRIYVGHIGKLIADRDSWKALQRLKDV